MLVGTYENPMQWTQTCGLDDAKEQQLLNMLVFGDVHQEPDTPAHASVAES